MNSLQIKICCYSFRRKDPETSDLVSYRALAEDAHAGAETLIKHWIIDLAQFLLDEKSVKEIRALLLSDHTVTHQIKDLVANMKTELIFPLQRIVLFFFFFLQMKESTDSMFCVVIWSGHQVIINKDLL